MCGLKDHPANRRLPPAVGLRVPDVRRAAEFYVRIGFVHVMAVPDENDSWLLCLLRCGSASILLGALDSPRFPRMNVRRGIELGEREVGVPIALVVPHVGATYAACVAAGCRVTVEPARQMGGNHSFRCVDPFGYEWQFTEKGERTTFDQLARTANAVWS
jgi:uncharacterized glyoxalase superfamily protein PhnB